MAFEKYKKSYKKFQEDAKKLEDAIVKFRFRVLDKYFTANPSKISLHARCFRSK